VDFSQNKFPFFNYKILTLNPKKTYYYKNGVRNGIVFFKTCNNSQTDLESVQVLTIEIMGETINYYLIMSRLVQQLRGNTY